jgi:hypothetical protein
MSVAITKPADLFIRSAALPAFSYTFYKSMQLVKGFMGTDANAPIVIDGLDFLQSGYYADQPVLKPISSLIQVRDYVNGGDTITPATLSTRNDDGVFVRFTSFVNIGEDAGRIAWGTPMQRLIEHFVEQTALEWMALMQTYVIGIAKGAITSMSGSAHTKTVWNASSRTNLSNGLILAGIQLLTDSQQRYFSGGKGVMITQSGPSYDLGIAQLGAGVQGIADNMVRQATPQTNGLPFVIAQDAALTTTDAGYDKYYTLVMGPSSMRVKLESPRFYTVDQRLDTGSVTNYLRADMDAYFEVPGKQYDKTSGGDNPTYATIVTSTNWDDTYTDAREIPMFLLEHNYSQN